MEIGREAGNLPPGELAGTLPWRPKDAREEGIGKAEREDGFVDEIGEQDDRGNHAEGELEALLE